MQVIRSEACQARELDAKSVWYTDGVKQHHDDGGNVIEAGNQNASRATSHSINSRGSGALNMCYWCTMTIAERDAIASALPFIRQEQDEIIETDSQASICMLTRYNDSLKTCSNANTRLCYKMCPPNFLPRQERACKPEL